MLFGCPARPLKLHWFWTLSTGKINKPAQPTLFIRRISGSSYPLTPHLLPLRPFRTTRRAPLRPFSRRHSLTFLRRRRSAMAVALLSSILSRAACTGPPRCCPFSCGHVGALPRSTLSRAALLMLFRDGAYCSDQSPCPFQVGHHHQGGSVMNLVMIHVADLCLPPFLTCICGTSVYLGARL